MAAVGRLKRRPDFLRVAAARRKWAAPGLILQAAKAKEDRNQPKAERDSTGPGDREGLRVGFTASRKVGNAVARNRARRRLRAAVGEVMPRHAKRGFDYVVIARAGTLTRSFDDLVADLVTGLQRLGAYRDADGARDQSSDTATERRER